MSGLDSRVRAVFSNPQADGNERQARILLTSTAIDTFGSGVNYAILSIFLTHVARFNGATVGIVIGVAAGVAIPSGYLVGRVVDSIGPRRPLLVTYYLQGAMAALLPIASGAIAICLVLSALMFFIEASRATRYAVMARVGANGGVSLRGRSTVVSNLGMALGVGAGGLLVGFAGASQLRWGLWANAATFVIAALIQRRLAEIPPVARKTATEAVAERKVPSSPFKDVAYLRVVAVNAVLMIQVQVFALGYPLWVATSGRVPLWTISVLLGLNTLLVALFQMRVVRRITSHSDAANGWRLAGLLFLTGCALMGAISVGASLAMPLYVAVILTAAALHTFGELWHGSGQFSLALGLADTTMMGRYQGIFNLGEGIAGCLAPLFVGYLCTSPGPWGWLGLGGMFALGGLAAGPVVRAASRNRVAQPA